jgi:hypothetical protein
VGFAFGLVSSLLASATRVVIWDFRFTYPISPRLVKQTASLRKSWLLSFIFCHAAGERERLVDGRGE